MAKIGGFDPMVGIQGLADGHAEIGRKNLPGIARLIPESIPPDGFALIYGRITDSTLQEMFAPYMKLDLKHRELLSPDVFFEALEKAAESFEGSSRDRDGKPKEGPMAKTAQVLAEVLADRELCEMLRNLVLKV